MKLIKHTNPNGVIVDIYVGERATVGKGATVGNGATVGERAMWVACLGDTGHGYMIHMCRIPDIGLVFTAGCRTFSTEQARNHWGDAAYPEPKRGRRILALIEAGLKIAEEMPMA